MEKDLKKIIEKLISSKKTISTMESCTGGGLVNEITNIEGSSEVLYFSAITYSTSYKIKMGVPKDIIDKYTVYSIETAKEMSRAIVNFTNTNYGIGITGKLKRGDKANLFGQDNKVYISLYDKDNEKFYTKDIEVFKEKRRDNKRIVIIEVIKLMKEVIK